MRHAPSVATMLRTRGASTPLPAPTSRMRRAFKRPKRRDVQHLLRLAGELRLLGVSDEAAAERAIDRDEPGILRGSPLPDAQGEHVHRHAREDHPRPIRLKEPSEWRQTLVATARAVANGTAARGAGAATGETLRSHPVSLQGTCDASLGSAGLVVECARFGVCVLSARRDSFAQAGRRASFPDRTAACIGAPAAAPAPAPAADHRLPLPHRPLPAAPPRPLPARRHPHRHPRPRPPTASRRCLLLRPSRPKSEGFEMPPFSIRIDPFIWLVRRQARHSSSRSGSYKFRQRRARAALRRERAATDLQLLRRTARSPCRASRTASGRSREPRSGSASGSAGKPLEGNVLRAIFTNYAYHYVATDERGEFDNVSHVERHLFGYFGSHSKWGAFTLAGGFGIGVRAQPSRTRCFRNDPPAYTPTTTGLSGRRASDQGRSTHASAPGRLSAVASDGIHVHRAHSRSV